MMGLKNHLNATFKLLTGDDVDGSILLEDTSTSSPFIDNKNFKKPEDKRYIDKSIKENDIQEAIVGLESTRPRKSRLKSQAVIVTRKVSSYFSDPSASMTPASSSSSQLSPSSSAALVRLMTLILTDSKLAANLQVAFYYMVVPMYHKL